MRLKLAYQTFYDIAIAGIREQADGRAFPCVQNYGFYNIRA